MISALAYTTRVVGYTLVPNEWLVLVLEPLHGVTFACLKTAQVEYVAAVTPQGLDATGQIIMSTITSLGGSLVGTAVGGYVEHTYGSTILYRGAALIVACVFMVYGTLVSGEHAATSMKSTAVGGHERLSASEIEDGGEVGSETEVTGATIGHKKEKRVLKRHRPFETSKPFDCNQEANL